MFVFFSIAFFKRCKESTDFHFEDVESQFDAIEKDFTTSDHTVQEGKKI